MQHVIGIAEMQVSNQPDDILVTYSLGSCVGLTLYDPVVSVGGMIHCMLPLSKLDPAKAQANPCMFTDTGVAKLLQAVFDMGAERRRIIAKVAGGASLLDEKGLFKIGERNHTVLRKMLWKNSVAVAGENVGGSISRTIYLNIKTGCTILKSCGKEVEL